MNRDERRETIIRELESTGSMMKETYNKKDVEKELREFQKQVVLKVFDEAHGKDLRICDVQAHINELAVAKGLELSPEITKFNAMSEALSACIAREIAGNKGERHMIRTLKMVKERNEFITNLELSDTDFVTEIDGIVITRKAIFLLETKYSVKDMVITSEGNYVEAENPGQIYSNLGEKVNEKEYLLRNALKNAGFDKNIKIEKMIVFSNSSSRLYNQYDYFSSCYCSQLPHVIDEYEGADEYSVDDIRELASILKAEQNSKKYAFDFDFEEYRYLFADALAYVEIVTEQYCDEIQCDEESKGKIWGKVAAALTVGLTLFAVGKMVKR